MESAPSEVPGLLLMAETSLVDQSSLALPADLCVAPPALLDLCRHCGAIHLTNQAGLRHDSAEGGSHRG
jgi:hypothetical protein